MNIKRKIIDVVLGVINMCSDSLFQLTELRRNDGVHVGVIRTFYWEM